MRLGMGLRLSDILKRGAAGYTGTLLDGMVSYWALDEEGGTRYDSVGSNDLTDNNTVGSVNSGPNGTAAKFVKANNEYLSAAEAQTFLSDDTWSVQWWMRFDGTKLTTNSATHDIVSADVGAGADLSLIVRYSYQSDGNMPFTVFVGDGVGYDAPVDGYLLAGGAADANWHHYILVRNGTNVSLYRDGTVSGWLFNGSLAPIQASGTTSKVSSEAEPVMLGKSASGGASDADLSSVAIWSRALTSDERAELYNAGAGFFYPFT